MATPAKKEIPTFRVDIARPPELRYVEIATAFGPTLRELGHVFDEILAALLQYKWLVFIAKFAAKVLLRRVHDGEQTREIRGFAKASGVDLYMVVALNVFLDAMMGCTAGCVRVKSKQSTEDKPDSRLMHFRTLDWGVDALRDLVIVVEYVDSSKDADHVIATSITYAGFVGMLTGMRENLSISLNYRPVHTCPHGALKRHQLMVVFGLRPSISSILRSVVFQPEKWADQKPGETSPIVGYARQISTQHSSPCYLTLCDGKEAVAVEKDLQHGRIKSAHQFIVQTNHDSDHSSCCPADAKEKDRPEVPHNELWLQDSNDRMGVIKNKWLEHSSNLAESNETHLTQANKNGACINAPPLPDGDDVDLGAIDEETLIEWMEDVHISNNFTHFACILDPVTAKIRWLERGPEPPKPVAEEAATKKDD